MKSLEVENPNQEPSRVSYSISSTLSVPTLDQILQTSTSETDALLSLADLYDKRAELLEELAGDKDRIDYQESERRANASNDRARASNLRERAQVEIK